MHPDEWPALRARIQLELKESSRRFSSAGPHQQERDVDDRQFVIDAYRRILGHDPDPGGLEHHARKVQSSVLARQTLKVRLFLSREKRSLLRADLSSTVQSGLRRWTGLRWSRQ